LSAQKGTRTVNDTGLLFDVEDELLARPARSVPTPVVAASETDLTPVAGVGLWGPLLDRLNVVAEADRRGLRPIGPGGYTGGECYRTLVEALLAGGEFLSDRSEPQARQEPNRSARRLFSGHPWTIPSAATST
jgi:hypothetical protein